MVRTDQPGVDQSRCRRGPTKPVYWMSLRDACKDSCSTWTARSGKGRGSFLARPSWSLTCVRPGSASCFASNCSRYGSGVLGRSARRAGHRRHGRGGCFTPSISWRRKSVAAWGRCPSWRSVPKSWSRCSGRPATRTCPFDHWEGGAGSCRRRRPGLQLRPASRLRPVRSRRARPFFAINLDARFPVGPGQFDPGCGSLAEAIAVAGGGRPLAIGKPEGALFQVAVRRLGCAASQAAMVGDSTASDITGGRAAGMFTIWLNPDQDTITPTSVDLEVKDLAELQKLWRQSRGSEGGDDGPSRS